MHYVCGLFLIEVVSIAVEDVGIHRELRERQTEPRGLFLIERAIFLGVLT